MHLKTKNLDARCPTAEPSSQVLAAPLLGPLNLFLIVCFIRILHVRSVSFYFLPVHCLSLYRFGNVLGMSKTVNGVLSLQFVPFLSLLQVPLSSRVSTFVMAVTLFIV